MRQTSTKKLFTGGESNKNASPRAKLFTAGESYKNASPRNDANQDQSQQNVKNSKPIPDTLIQAHPSHINCLINEMHHTF